MYTVVMRFNVDVAAHPTTIRALRGTLATAALRHGRSAHSSFFSAVDDPRTLLLVLPGRELGDDHKWLETVLPPGAVSDRATVCQSRHWYWNASHCAMTAAFTLIEAAPPRAERLIREIDDLARTRLAPSRGFVDFQLLQGVNDPGHVGVLHEWQTGDLMAAARQDTADALDRIAADAGSRASQYIALQDAALTRGVHPRP